MRRNLTESRHAPARKARRDGRDKNPDILVAVDKLNGKRGGRQWDGSTGNTCTGNVSSNRLRNEPVMYSCIDIVDCCRFSLIYRIRMEADAVSKSYTTTRFVCNNVDIVALRLLAPDYIADGCSYDARLRKEIRSYCVVLRIRYPPANRLEQSTNCSKFKLNWYHAVGLA